MSEEKEKGLLFFCTALRLVAIDPAEMRFSVKDRNLPPIPARKSVYYLDAGLPHCAGYAVHGSKLYMMGGHRMRPETLCDPLKIPNPMIVNYPAAAAYDAEDDDGEPVFNSYVYSADLTTNGTEFEFYPVCKMKAPKNKPKVLEIKGKLYVLSNYDNGGGYLPESYDALDYPNFEVYDPKTNSAEALPNPPFFPPSFRDKNADGAVQVAIRNWFRSRGKIYVKYKEAFYSYKLETRRWRKSMTYFWGIRSIPYGFLVPGFDDVLLHFYESGNLVAKLIYPGNTVFMMQELMPDLELEEAVNATKGFVYLHWNKAVFVGMGDFKVGAVVPGGDFLDNNLVVFVFTFTIHKVDIPLPRKKDLLIWRHYNIPDCETKFLSVSCLNKGIYNVGSRRNFREDVLLNAFYAKACLL